MSIKMIPPCITPPIASILKPQPIRDLKVDESHNGRGSEVATCVSWYNYMLAALLTTTSALSQLLRSDVDRSQILLLMGIILFLALLFIRIYTL